jgi:hypothetical protein
MSRRKPPVIDAALVEVRLEPGPKANAVPLLARLLRRLRDRDQRHDAERAADRPRKRAASKTDLLDRKK